MRGYVDTAGEHLAIECSDGWVAELITEGSGGELRPLETADPSVLVRVETERDPFETRGWKPLTRGAWERDGEVVIENACTAGFDLHVRGTSQGAEFTYRWRPPSRDRAAAWILRSRFHLLARAVLMQYPALWWAGTRGRAPIHASACSAGGTVALVTAAGGIGRSTIILDELRGGGLATGDNLAVGDGETVWGLVEPVRVENGSGRRMPHGRNEAQMVARAEALVPDRLVVLERGRSDESSLETCGFEAAGRCMTTSTYMAGELRRYWAFAATLSAGTGFGPAHPPVTDVASAFAAGLPCFLLTLARTPGARLSDLLADVEVEACA
jgi:hypothetical protein